MNYFSRDSLTSSSHEKYGWLAIFGLFSFLGLFFLAGAGRFLIFLYPICSFAVGIYLFQYYPRLYILYTFWLWFLSGLIRRLIDYQSGEYTMGGFYTTPEFVTLISSLTFIRLFPKELRSIGLPFILCVGSVVYGTLIGIINNPLTDFSIVDSIFGFLCPIIFGFHLYSYWQEYPTLSRSINNIFINGVLVMGLYGIYQYVVAPAWDRFFLTLTELAARGTPESFGIRVWSTTSAAHQLVFPLIPGILLSLCPPFNWTQYLVLLFGVITLLASVVRTGWLCLLLVVTLYIASKKPKQQSKIIILIAVIFSLILFVVLSLSQFGELVIQRFLSFQSLDSDEALNLRTETFSSLFANIVFDPIGKGFGFSLDAISNISDGDGTFLPMFLWFGLIGTIVYFLGVFMIIAKIIKTKASCPDNFLIIIKIICFGLMPMMFSAQYFPELPGLTVWTFLSLGLAAYKYHNAMQYLEDASSIYSRFHLSEVQKDP